MDIQQLELGAEDTGNFMNTLADNAWTWIVVGIVILAAIALIWYFLAKPTEYHKQNNDR